MDTTHHHDGQHLSQDARGVDHYAYGSGGTVQTDDFGSLFPADTNASYPTWDAEAAIDPQAQANNFHNGWAQGSLSNNSSLQQPNDPYPPAPYGHAFSRNPNNFAFSGYSNSPYPQYPVSSYDPSLSFGQESLLDPNLYNDARPSVYQARDQFGQTIAPAALHGFPNTIMPTTLQSNRETSHMRNEIQQNVEGRSLLQQPLQNRVEAQQNSNGLSRQIPSSQLYDEQRALSIAIAVPNGTASSDFLVKDSLTFQAATNSEPLSPFLYLGREVLYIPAEEQSISVPKLPKRSSIRDLQKMVLQAQGSKPWTKDQRPALKKLRLTSSRHLQTIPNGAAQQAADESPSADESTSEEDPSTGSASEDEEDEIVVQEISPLPATRPADPDKAIEYDIVKAVWAPRSSTLLGADIRTALGSYWSTVKSIRDAWQEAVKATQAAEVAKDAAAIGKSKLREAEMRQVMERAMNLTIDHGHPDIVEKLGEILQLFAVFYQFIGDRFKEGDYNAPLIELIFQLMGRYSTIDQSHMEKAKMDKLIPRIIKRCNAQIKDLAQRVLDKVASTPKDKSTEGDKDAPKVAKTTSLPRKAEELSKSKRESEAVPSSISARKSGSNAPPKSTLPATSKTANSLKNPAVIKGVAKLPAATSNASTGVKVKVNHVVSKPPSFFSGLQSASKKPGTSMTAQKVAQESDTKIIPTNEKATKPPSVLIPPPKPVFSFAETMANLTRAKEPEPKLEVGAERPPETEEEKKKRLRKEGRRKLRVSFKTGDDLVQVHLFHHDPDEELGHDDNMIRDVGDIKSEGCMLKIMSKKSQGIDTDEDAPNDIETLRPWVIPSLTDFSDLPVEESEKNFTSRGGLVEAKSHERVIQEQRGQQTLIAIYSSPGDIPATPREPADPFNGDASTEVRFGTPERFTREREKVYWGASTSQSRTFNQPTAPASNKPPDISHLLSILNNRPPGIPVQPAQPLQQPVSQSTANSLEAIFARYAQTPAAVPQPPVRPAIDPSLQAALAIFNSQNQAQSQPLYSTAYSVPVASTSSVPDIASLLAQINGQPANMQQQGFASQAAYQISNDRKRQFEAVDRSIVQYPDEKRMKAGDANMYRLPCKYWQDGKCRRGESCTYRHDLVQ